MFTVTKKTMVDVFKGYMLPLTWDLKHRSLVELIPKPPKRNRVFVLLGIKLQIISLYSSNSIGIVLNSCLHAYRWALSEWQHNFNTIPDNQITIIIPSAEKPEAGFCSAACIHFLNGWNKENLRNGVIQTQDLPISCIPNNSNTRLNKIVLKNYER